MVIAIDGPAGSGKSTVARRLAGELGITYLDSGAMYRCVALAALAEKLPLTDGEALGELARRISIDLSDGAVTLDRIDVTETIRAPEVSEVASHVSIHPQVREALVAQQREMIAAGDYVAEGRDIGTVVSPDAPLKVFLTATPAERARRRAQQTGQDVRVVAAAQQERDERDSERAHGALRRAADSVELDTTALSIAEVVERIAALARERGLA